LLNVTLTHVGGDSQFHNTKAEKVHKKKQGKRCENMANCGGRKASKVLTMGGGGPIATHLFPKTGKQKTCPRPLLTQAKKKMKMRVVYDTK